MPTIRENLRSLPPAAWILFAGTFINRFGSFVMVFLVAWMSSRGYSPAQAGLAVGSYGAGHLLANLAGGYLADRIGRRATIAISMFSAGGAILALSQCESLPSILFFSALSGLTAELYRPASSALLTDLTPPGARLTAFAVYRLAINLGFAAGPAVAGFLAQRSFFYLFVGDAVTCALFGVLALAALPKGNAHPAPTASHTRDLIAAIRHDRRFLYFLAASVSSTMVFFQFESSFPLHVLASGYSSFVYGALVSLNGALIVLFELGLTSLTQRYRPQNVLALGYVLVGAGYAVNLAGGTLPVLIASVVIWTFGEIASAPVGSAYVADLAPPALRGGYMGAWGFTWSIGLVLGPILGTWLFGISPTALWVTCLALGGASALLMIRDTRQVARPAEPATL